MERSRDLCFNTVLILRQRMPLDVEPEKSGPKPIPRLILCGGVACQSERWMSSGIGGCMSMVPLPPTKKMVGKMISRVPKKPNFCTQVGQARRASQAEASKGQLPITIPERHTSARQFKCGRLLSKPKTWTKILQRPPYSSNPAMHAGLPRTCLRAFAMAKRQGCAAAAFFHLQHAFLFWWARGSRSKKPHAHMHIHM